MARRPSPPPKPFFSYLSRDVLTDYYDGNNAHRTQLLKNSDMAVVMYYASWSRRCKQMRMVFEKLARGFSGCTDVNFLSAFSVQDSGSLLAYFVTDEVAMLCGEQETRQGIMKAENKSHMSSKQASSFMFLSTSF